MKYNGNINYKFCIENGLNLSEGALMDSLTQLSTWATGIEVEGEIYYNLTAGKLIEELPIISEKKNTFLVILKNLINKDMIKRYSKNNTSYYSLTELGKTFIGCGKKSTQCGFKSRPGVDLNQDNNNTIYNSTNPETFSSGEEKDYLSKGEENKLIKNIEEEKNVSSQEKENKNKEIAANAEKIFKFWNNRKQLDKHWLGVRKFDDKVKGILVKILKTYSKEDIQLGMDNYIKEIKSRKGDSGSYKDHRFTLHKFFTQSNGFVEYYNKII